MVKTFTLDEEAEKKEVAFRELHNHKGENFGAVGEYITYQFTLMGRGMIAVILCSCGGKEDLTTDRELVLSLRGTGLLGSRESEELRKRGLFSGTALCLTSGEPIRDGRTITCCGTVWRGPVVIPPHQAPPAALRRTPEEHNRLQFGGPATEEEEIRIMINAGRESRYY